MVEFMKPMLENIRQMGLVPVIKLDQVEDAIPLATALYEGGLPCAEITFRTAAAAKSIKKIKQALPEMLVGAGTILNTKQVEEAIEAGAEFIVSPGFSEEVVSYCLAKNMPIIPGCITPSEVEQAIGLGLSTVKFFPAEQSGGLAMIKAMSAPYPQLKFMPTGGINEKNLNDYLAFEKVLACGGSFMVPDQLVKQKDFQQIKQLTHKAVMQVLGFSLGHIGINASTATVAGEIATALGDVLGETQHQGNSSIFVGDRVEVMKQPFLGEHGHIAIKTHDVSRAVTYLKRKGYTVRKETAKYDDGGQLIVIYLEQEFGGFALHLVKS